MYLYSFKDIHKIFEESELVKSASSERNKNILIDKHNYIISSIIINALKSDEITNYVNLYSQILKNVLGDKYSEILNNLINLKIIDVNNIYSVGNFSKSYRFNKKVYNNYTIEKVGVLSANFRKKLKIVIKESNKSPVIKKIIKNTSNLMYCPNGEVDEEGTLNLEYFETDKEYSFISDFRFWQMHEALTRFNYYKTIEEFYNENIFFTPTIAESGRIYHFVSVIPRNMRQCLRTKKDELLFEVDMASAQPTLLILEWIKRLYSSNSLQGIEESKKLLKLIYEGNFYNHIKENSSLFNSLKYTALKKKILSTLYKEQSCKYNKELIRLFPNFMEWINNTKKEYGYKSVSLIGHTAEAEIFVNVFKELNTKTFALIIHDSILTTEENLEEIRRKLINKLIVQYPILNSFTSFKNVFKTKQVSLNNMTVAK